MAAVDKVFLEETSSGHRGYLRVRPGVRKYVKRALNRRDRKVARVTNMNATMHEAKAEREDIGLPYSAMRTIVVVRDGKAMEHTCLVSHAIAMG